MKTIICLSISLMLLTLSLSAQKDTSGTVINYYPVRKVTIEPAIGPETSQMFDLIISNLIHWNLRKHLAIVSYTSYTYNNTMDRDFNFVETNYNYSLGQKFGVGTSLYMKHSAHTFSFMGGIRFDAYKETLKNPDFEEVSASVSSISPDVGLLYNLKIGKKKYFFSYRMYIPLYPYPFKSSDILVTDGNIANISLEFGLGIRLK